MADIAMIGYMKEPELKDEATTIGVSDKVYRALIYYIAGLTFETYAEADKARLMFDEANDLMGFVAQPQMQQ